MKLAILSKPYLNNKYKGLYRSGAIPEQDLINDIYKKDQYLYSLWDWYVNTHNQGIGIDTTDSYFKKAVQICKLAQKYGCNHDIIMYTDDRYEPIDNEKVIFLGYDVCGDSMYYSYLGDNAFEIDSFEKQTPCFKVFFKYFSPKLNNFKLFSRYSDAQEYSDILNELAKIEYVETETNWRPVSIYAVDFNNFDNQMH